MATQQKELQYTEAGRARLTKLQQELLAEIEGALRERKFVPGEEVIEVTASDIDDLSRQLSLVFRSRVESRLLMRRIVIASYFVLGMLTASAGLLYPYFNKLIENPVRLMLVAVGIVMSLASVLLQAVERARMRDQMSRLHEAEKALIDRLGPRDQLTRR